MSTTGECGETSVVAEGGIRSGTGETGVGVLFVGVSEVLRVQCGEAGKEAEGTILGENDGVVLGDLDGDDGITSSG